MRVPDRESLLVVVLGLALSGAGCAEDPAAPAGGPEFPLPEDVLAPEHPFPATVQLDPERGLRLPAWVLEDGLPAGAAGDEARGLFGQLAGQLAGLDGVGVTATVRAFAAGSVDPASLAAGVRVLPVDGAFLPEIESALGGDGRIAIRPRGAWQGGATYVVALAGVTGPRGQPCRAGTDAARLLGLEPLADPILEAERLRVRAALVEGGLAPEETCLAFSFRVQDTRGELLALRDGLIARAARVTPTMTIDAVQRAEEVVGLEQARFVDRVLYGTYASPELRGEDGLLVRARLDGREEPPVAALRFAISIPRRRAADGVRPPYRVVMGLHGLGGEIDSTVPVYADLLAEAGFAYVTIDGVGHGSRAGDLPPELALLDYDDLRRPRDAFRQTLADLLQLRLALAAGALEAATHGAVAIERTGLGWMGGSYGGIFGTLMMAVDPELEAALVEGCGGPWSQIVHDSEVAPPLALGLFAGRTGLAPDEDTARVMDRFFELGQWLLDPGDPSALAEYVRRAPLSGTPRRILLQYWGGETTMPNSASERLVTAIGLPLNVAAADPAGVAAAWRYDVTDWGLEPGVGAHAGFWHIPEARAQALHFLATRGTEIPAP